MPRTPLRRRVLRAATTASGVVLTAFLAVGLAPAAQAAETFVPISADSGFVPISAEAGFVPISADSGFVPINADTGFVPINADSGFVPIAADTGFVPISADTGFVPINAEAGFVPIALGAPSALAGSWHLSSTGYWTKFLCEKAGQVQWPLFPTECTRDGSRWAMWVWF